MTRHELSVHFAGVADGHVNGVAQLAIVVAQVPSAHGILLLGNSVGGTGQLTTVVAQLASEQRTGNPGGQVGC